MISQINSTFFSNELSCSHDKRKKDKLYFLLSFIWGGSLGAACHSFLRSKRVFPIPLTIGILAANWIIFPFKPRDEFYYPDMKSKEKAYRIMTYVLGILTGIFVSLLFNISVDAGEKQRNSPSLLLFCEPIAILSINLLANYLLWKRPASNKKLNGYILAKTSVYWGVEKVNQVFKYFTHLSANFLKGPSEQVLPRIKLEEFEALKKEHTQIAAIFGYLKILIENDVRLRTSLQASYSWLTFPKMNKSQPFENLLVEEWIIEMQKRAYWMSIITYTTEFLESNPIFRENLINSLAEENTEKAREALHFLNVHCIKP
ncbi:hypothetical protein NCS13_1_0867 [Neochlamydia sp. S13]|nr:hypothetical protein NCS13_1_0867 [Neochlamydia sp. S13]